jgi:hypothetical protein
MALILSSGSNNVYDGCIDQYYGMTRYFGCLDAGIFTAYGDQNKSEEKLQALRDFGASV